MLFAKLRFFEHTCSLPFHSIQIPSSIKLPPICKYCSIIKTYWLRMVSWLSTWTCPAGSPLGVPEAMIKPGSVQIMFKQYIFLQILQNHIWWVTKMIFSKNVKIPKYLKSYLVRSKYNSSDSRKNGEQQIKCTDTVFQLGRTNTLWKNQDNPYCCDYGFPQLSLQFIDVLLNSFSQY